MIFLHTDANSTQETLDHVHKRGNNKNTMNLLSWVTKGCVLNWQPTSTKACLDELIANLENTELTTSQGAVKGFQMLCTTSVSSKQEYNLVAGMYFALNHWMHNLFRILHIFIPLYIVDIYITFLITSLFLNLWQLLRFTLFSQFQYFLPLL